MSSFLHAVFCCIYIPFFFASARHTPLFLSYAYAFDVGKRAFVRESKSKGEEEEKLCICLKKQPPYAASVDVGNFSGGAKSGCR